MKNEAVGYNYRLGTDFFLSDQHTIGFLVSGNNNDSESQRINRIEIASQETATLVDSILVANNRNVGMNTGNTYNLNYGFANGKGRSLNIDFDYGDYNNDSDRSQPNLYYDAEETEVLTEVINAFNTPTDIEIYTAKLDFEEELLGGKLGLGAKFSAVNSDNTFLVFDVVNGVSLRDNARSNIFIYDEHVYAGYFNFSRAINDKWNFSAGLRAEQTDATGNLQAFEEGREEPPVILDYLQWFPSAGLTWQVTPMNTLSLNYGRRINRPDYNVLNPFNNQWSELSYEKGNPFLRPEIVNNLELGYTLKYRYNFKLGYSRTLDQITRLIAPDDLDNRASFITWENLATQTIYSFSASLPFQVMEGWSSYWNVSAAYQDNQADYGDGAIVDVQIFTYSFYQQQTIDLPAGFKGEVSGYFAGPGVWGGVFKYETSWSLDVGLQKKFFNDALNVRLAASDLFYETGWDGISVFNGLVSAGGGRWDSRRVSMSLSYSFGNQNVKSRRRNTGLEEEAKRLNN
jgi:outer membrane receptor protein involved in Fe transport